jgi:hypothetical protein
LGGLGLDDMRGWDGRWCREGESEGREWGEGTGGRVTWGGRCRVRLQSASPVTVGPGQYML